MEENKTNQVLTNVSKTYTENSYLRMLVNLIPYIGSSLDICFSERWNKITMSRFEDFIISVQEEFSDIKNKYINKDFVESEDFADLARMCINSSAKARHHEKILLFAKIFSGAVTSAKFDIDEFEEILPTLELVSERELLVLNHLDTWETNLNDNYLKMLDYSEVRTSSQSDFFGGIPVYKGFWDAFIHELITTNNLKKEDIEYLLHTTSQKGLFTFDWFDVSKQNNTDGIDIMVARESFQHTMEGKLTPLYKRMKKYILTQDIETQKKEI